MKGGKIRRAEKEGDEVGKKEWERQMEMKREMYERKKRERGHWGRSRESVRKDRTRTSAKKDKRIGDQKKNPPKT